MTIQQPTILIMTVVGIAFFFMGRILANKFSSKKPSFIRASIVTARGIAAYFSVVVSWAGALFAVVCIFPLFS